MRCQCCPHRHAAECSPVTMHRHCRQRCQPVLSNRHVPPCRHVLPHRDLCFQCRQVLPCAVSAACPCRSAAMCRLEPPLQPTSPAHAAMPPCVAMLQWCCQRCHVPRAPPCATKTCHLSGLPFLESVELVVITTLRIAPFQPNGCRRVISCVDDGSQQCHPISGTPRTVKVAEGKSSDQLPPSH